MDFFTLIQVLPALVQLVIQFLNLVKTKGAPQTLGAMGQALNKLKEAQTHEDHMSAAQELALALSGKSKS